ncbi:hypothetical protein COO59_12805 [Mixta theicola]|uniref:Uncharacterized protein n=1 Tax=Mixta theicola TaxID=1458355 RepID=A0A2K1Q840_9GAMM|nr:hypothetical protein COO59_12805 [Mixta theicola]GLR07590.1 hypothetical protein GCM10007905_03090 [Mixta theicola]
MRLLKRILKDIWADLSVYIMIGLVALVAWVAGILLPYYVGIVILISIVVVIFVFYKYLIK